MEKHLDFDEIIEYVYCTELTNESARLAHKINSHIFACESCRKIYNRLVHIYDEVDMMQHIQCMDKQQKELLGQLIMSRDFQEKDNSIIECWVKNLCKFSLALFVEVKENKKLSLNKCDYLGDFSGMCFSYPIALGTRSGEEHCDINNILVDEDNANNKIELNDGKTTVFLDIDEWGDINPELVVIDGLGNLICATKMIQKENVWIGKFTSVSDTEYKIYIK